MTRDEKIKMLDDFCNKWATCSDGCPMKNLCQDTSYSCEWNEMTDNMLDKCLDTIGETNPKEQETNPSDTKSDMVCHPAHYNQGKVECIDAMAAATVNKSGIEAVCVSNIIKYLWRYEAKNGLEDVKKAQFYLNRLIDELEDKSE